MELGLALGLGLGLELGLNLNLNLTLTPRMPSGGVSLTPPAEFPQLCLYPPAEFPAEFPPIHANSAKNSANSAGVLAVCGGDAGGCKRMLAECWRCARHSAAVLAVCGDVLYRRKNVTRGGAMA